MNLKKISVAFYNIKIIKIAKLIIFILLVSLSIYILKNPMTGIVYDENGKESDLRSNIDIILFLSGLLLFVLEVLHISEIGVLERNFYTNVQEKHKPNNSPKVDENTSTLVDAINERRVHRNADEFMKND